MTLTIHFIIFSVQESQEFLWFKVKEDLLGTFKKPIFCFSLKGASSGMIIYL